MLTVHHSFVGGLGDYLGAKMLVSAIISLAHALGLKVIAEGVETEDQFEQLREMGCDLAQGHLFSEPLTAEGVADLLAAAHHRNPRPPSELVTRQRLTPGHPCR